MRDYSVPPAVTEGTYKHRVCIDCKNTFKESVIFKMQRDKRSIYICAKCLIIQNKKEQNK